MRGVIPGLRLGLAGLIAAALATGTTLSAVATGTGGVRISLTCGTLPAGSATFMVSANGSGSAVTVPCGGSAIVTNSAWSAGAIAYIIPASGPVGTLLAEPFTSRLSLTTGVVNVSMAEVPIPSGGLTIELTCAAGAAGSAVIRVTANQTSSTLAVACGQSATFTNPAWTEGAIAKIDSISAPKGTYLNLTVDHQILRTTPISYATSLLPCPTGRVRVAACPTPPPSALEQFFFGSRLRMILSLTVIPVILMWIFIVPFEFWIIRGWIRYFSRTRDPHEVIADLSARPGLGWWVRRYVAFVRWKHRLFKAPLPPGFESDQAA